MSFTQRCATKAAVVTATLCGVIVIVAIYSPVPILPASNLPWQEGISRRQLLQAERAVEQSNDIQEALELQNSNISGSSCCNSSNGTALETAVDLRNSSGSDCCNGSIDGFASEMETNQTVGDLLATAAGLKVRMPIYMATLAAIVKPFLFALIFGPPMPGQEEGWYKPHVTLVFVILPACFALKADFLLTRSLLGMTSLTACQRCLGVLMIFDNSSNLSSLVCAAASVVLVGHTAKFKLLHQRDHQTLRTSTFTVVFDHVVVLLFAILIPVAIVASLPALLAYIYIAYPAFVLLVRACIVCPEVMRGLIRSCFASQVVAAVYDEVSQDEVLENWTASMTIRPEVYAINKAYYEETGSTKIGMTNYFYYTFSALFFPLGSAASARLLMGSGYWSSLIESWNDRHWNVWLHYMLDSSMDALGQAQQVTDDVHDFLVLVQRWMVAINHFV